MNFYTSVHLFKNEVLVRGYKDGKRFKESVNYRPYIFEPNSIYKQRGVDTPFRTLRGEPVYKKEFDSILDARQYVNQFKDIEGKSLYGLTNFTYTFINDAYPGEIDYDPKLISVVTLDIEVSSEGGFPNIQEASHPLTAITLRKNGHAVVFGLNNYNNEDPDNITYIKCKSEEDMIEKFLVTWESPKYMPDVLTGWNVEFFDVPYLINRITRQIGPHSAKRLSPWKILDEKTIQVLGKDVQVYTPLGINILDYMQCYRKFSFSQQESFKLDHIAFIELGEKKLDWSSLGFETLDEFYKGDFQNYINYNIRDTLLVDKLEDKLKFLEQIFAIAYDGKVNLQDAFTSVRMWDIIIHNFLLTKGIVVPISDKGKKDDPIVGAYVKDPQIGMHKWVVSFDLNSLYPHLIMQYNISPETLKGIVNGLSVDSILNGALHDEEIRDGLKKHNVTIAATGCTFDKDVQGFLPTLMEKMYNDRLKFKNQMLAAKKKYEKNKTYELEKEIARCHNMQLAKKIQLNSAYGALSNIYFRWFDTRLAESITKSGQLSIRWIANHMNQYLNKVLKNKEEKDFVIAIDTDSMYLDLEDLVNSTCKGKSTQQIVQYLDDACQKIIEPFIDKKFDELGEYVNAFSQKMKMKREAIADKGIFTAKKRYILNVHNLEGVAFEEPKLKMQGIEAVRSSTPSACRTNIKDALKVIMNSTEEEMIEFIDNFRKKFYTLPYEEVAFPRSVRGLAEYGDPATIYRKATPIHVKGALIYNHLIKKLRLEKKYQLIGEGEKVKFCYLLVPNPAQSTVIATPGTLAKELDLESYIDYETQFEKSFVEPLRTILNVIGWQTEKQSTLERFF